VITFILTDQQLGVLGVFSAEHLAMEFAARVKGRPLDWHFSSCSYWMRADDLNLTIHKLDDPAWRLLDDLLDNNPSWVIS
jgi:hypothetical protein